jgi:hypothetical protein
MMKDTRLLRDSLEIPWSILCIGLWSIKYVCRLSRKKRVCVDKRGGQKISKAVELVYMDG